MGASSDINKEQKEQNEPQIEPLNEIDCNQLPYKHVKNRELYLIKLISKKLSIIDNHDRAGALYKELLERKLRKGKKVKK